MTPTPIYKDHTGQWRPVNPNFKSGGRDKEIEETKAWYAFEQSITYHEFPNSPEVKPSEVVMAYLQWRFNDGLGWKFCTDNNPKWAQEYNFKIEQIWILAPSPEASRGKDVRGNEEETVEQAAKAEMGVSYEPHMSQTDASFIEGAIFGSSWQKEQSKSVEAHLLFVINQIENIAAYCSDMTKDDEDIVNGILSIVSSVRNYQPTL